MVCAAIRGGTLSCNETSDNLPLHFMQMARIISFLSMSQYFVLVTLVPGSKKMLKDRLVGVSEQCHHKVSSKKL